MTRKDYIRLARTLYEARPVDPSNDTASRYEAGRFSQHEHDCDKVADALAADNSRFDRKRFLKACREGC